MLKTMNTFVGQKIKKERKKKKRKDKLEMTSIIEPSM